MNNDPNVPTLVDAGEIAEYLRVDRKSILNKMQWAEGFPQPVNGTSKPRLWQKQQVIDFLFAHPKG